MKILFNTKHLKDQAAERVQAHDGKPFRLTNQHLEALKNAILSNAPGDWRFTEKPEADFMLSFLCDGVPIKFVGRSYRESSDSEQLFDDFMGHVNYGIENRGRFQWPAVGSLAHRYLKCLADPEAEICHEFKTILEPGDILSTEFEEDRNERDRFPHRMLQDRARVGYNLRKRPNALVLPGRDGDLELWVRQGHPFLSVSAGRPNIGSYCIFARLSPEGVTQDNGIVWNFDPYGNASQVGEAVCGTPFKIADSVQLYRGTRSKNYWDLPTHLDAMHNDANFSARECARREMTPERTIRARLRLMELVYQEARRINEAWIEKKRADRQQRYDRSE